MNNQIHTSFSRFALQPFHDWQGDDQSKENQRLEKTVLKIPKNLDIIEESFPGEFQFENGQSDLFSIIHD